MTLTGPTDRLRPFAMPHDIVTFINHQDEVEELADKYGDKFAFVPCISSLRDDRYPLPDGFAGLRGRVSDIVPQVRVSL